METKQIRKTFSRVGLGIGLLYLITTVIAVGLQYLLLAVAPDILYSSWAGWLLSYIPLYCIALPIMLLIIKGIPNHKGGPLETTRLSIPGLLAGVAACWFITLFLNMVMYALSGLIEMLKGSEVVNVLEAQASNANPWVNLIIVGLVAPIMEEFIFRKKLYDKLIVFGGKVYILVSAMLFSLFHANFYQLAYAFILGLVFGAVMYQTGKLAYCIALHMLINLMGAGGSTLVAYYGSELVNEVWNILLVILAVIGLGVTIWWLVKKRRSISFAPAEVTLPSKGIIFANPGMIVMLVILVGFTLANMLLV